MSDEPSELRRFDAFISYSRHDVEFAEWLENRLERYRPPKGVAHRRRLNVFRDIHDLLGPTLPQAIQDALHRSGHLIVVCSPRARESKWVDLEIERFAAEHGAEKITPVLLDGTPDGSGADRAFPAALEALLDDPLAADFREVHEESPAKRRARRREGLLFVLARLLDVDKEELARRQRARTVRLLGTLVVVLAVLTVAFAWISWEAVRQRNSAPRTDASRDVPSARRASAGATRS